MNQLELYDHRINNRLVWIVLTALLVSQWQMRQTVRNVMMDAYGALVTSTSVYDEIHHPDPATSDNNPILEA